MRILRQKSLVLAVCLAIGAVLTGEVTTLAQCGMCKTALAGSNNALFIRNFNIGVLVLLVPPVTIFCSIFIALRRHRAADEEPKN
ncbi:MAG TPA: hypothetical protein VNO50_22815 [Pyrinomonadaceae bacterium]|nr:hypothetical protein [Pyrinomonadaceae bacterium]